MEDLSSEENLRRHHRVLIRQVQLSVEHATFVGSALGTSDLHKEVSVVCLTWLCVYSYNYIENKVKDRE